MKKATFGIFILLFAASFLMAEHVSISASAFTGHSQSTGYTRDSYGRYIKKTISSGFLHAQVSLPDGCIIKNIRVHFVDNSDTGYLDVNLYRTNHFSGSYSILFSVDSSGATTSTDMQWLTDSTCSPASYRKVQNGPLTWNLSIRFTEADTDLRVYSVQIEYEM